MKQSKVFLTIVFCTSAIVSYAKTPDTNTKPDNTAVNKRGARTIALINGY